MACDLGKCVEDEHNEIVSVTERLANRTDSPQKWLSPEAAAVMMAKTWRCDVPVTA
jgi:hypothetical protein